MKEKIFSGAGASARSLFHRETNPRQRILLADGEPLIRQLNRELLMDSGYQVDAAEDGAAAWDALLVNNYDLLITDNDIPKVSGVNLIRKVHATRMALPVIMAAKQLPTWEFAQYPWLRPAAVLLKPCPVDCLLGAVQAVLHASARARAEITAPPNWYNDPSTADLRR